MTPYYEHAGVTIYHGEALEVLRQLESESIHCCVTSPPYWGLRDYGVEGQLGLETTPEEYVAKLVAVLVEAKRVLRGDGTLWLNLGDCYAGHNLPGWRGGNEIKNGGVSNKNGVGYVAGMKPKDLVGIPWRVAFALQADGWYLRSEIIWAKSNPMPESVQDRPTKAHEQIFLLSKSGRYYYDGEAIVEDAVSGCDLGLLRGRFAESSDAISWHAESIRQRQLSGVDSRTAGDGKRNKRSVWTVTTQPFPEAHFATFPPDLILPCILAGCPAGGTILDPFLGAGTTALVAKENGRHCIGIELKEEYCEMAARRVAQDVFDWEDGRHEEDAIERARR